MKVAFLVPGFPRLSETFILNQITGLLDLGCDVRIFSQYPPQDVELHADVVRYDLMSRVTYLDIIGSRVVRIWSGIRILRRYGPTHPWTVLKALNPLLFGKDAISLKMLHRTALFLDGFDVIMCHFGHAGIVGADLVRAGVQSKLVTMFHGYDIRAGLEEGPDMYRTLFGTVDVLLSISTYNRENLIRLGADPQSIIDHPVGIDIRRFSTHETQHGVNSPLIILTVARLVREKGIDCGLKAIAEIRRRNPELNLEYRICGGGVLEPQLKRLASELRIDDMVKFCGPMNQDAVVAEMERADIFLLPSVAEALPVCLMEAQAMRLPIVATDVGSVSEVVVSEKSGFMVPANDTEAMADRLLLLAQDPQLRREMGAAGRAHVLEKYDVCRLNRRLLALFVKLSSGVALHGPALP